jgi:Zn-dependent metalloprotease
MPARRSGKTNLLAHHRFLQFISMIVVFTLLFSSVSLPSVSAQGGDGLQRQVNPQTGKVSFLGPENGRSLSASRALGTFIRPQDPALALAKRFGPEFGLRNPERDLTEMKTNRPGDGSLTVRYQQNHEGVPVMGGELVVNTNENGDLYSMNGEVSTDISLSTQPAVDAEQAREVALRAVAKWYQKSPEDFTVSEPALWIYDESLLRSSVRPAELVWRMDVTPLDKAMPVRELVLVNAQRGSISLHFNQMDTAWHSSDTHSTSTLLATTWYVAVSGNDSSSCSAPGSPCATINGAIGKAAAGDTIRVAIGTYTGSGAETVLINKSIVLSGGWNAGFTAQTGSSVVDGQGSHRVIKVNSGATATISRFTVQNGAEPFDGAAGIWNEGTLTINASTITGNVAATNGGGIFNIGTLTLNNSTVSKNKGFDGGGIANGGYWLDTGTISLTINNSTISQNVGYNGGGIQNGYDGAILLNNATVTENRTIAGYPGGGIHNNAGGSVTLRNTILANNLVGTERIAWDCYGNIVSNGYNLIGSKLNCTFTPATGDLVGTDAAPINPRLTALRNNGGLTFTHALMPGSPAIDKGNTATPGSGGNACLAVDQRGVTRPVGGRCDIGAYEGSLQWTPSYHIRTYTANNTSSLPGSLICTETDPTCFSGDWHAKAAHEYATGTYQLYASQFNRNSIDNQGMTVISSVHYDSNYDNANWNGEQMIYGDAYGFPLADDVVAHELTHGVTQYESNLFYYYQSGAINESFSDLWGEYYDQTNGLGDDDDEVKWQMGEEVWGLGSLRSMSHPPAYGDPDRMSSTNYYEDEDDNGGVHHNSGVNNKAVYLMVQGDTFNGKTVTPLGWTKTAAVYYEVNTKLLSSGADYSDLYYALQQACSNLIGQKGITAANCVEVKDALDAVEMNAQPATNFNSDAPLCVGGGPSIVFTDNLENGTANWTFSNGAYPRWRLDTPFGPFAQSGLHSLYADDYPGIVTDAIARLKPLAVPANAYLHFAHAYGFESSDAYYDGGVLEYSTNNAASWSDAGALIDHNGYDGVLFSGAGNPLSGRWAFAGDSHGYISTRLNLASLAGKTVIFRWRMGLDEAAYDWGWWVDNVKLYTCIPAPAAFNKTAPANGATNQSSSLTLNWGASAGATSYQFCYDTTNDNACANWINNGMATSKALSGLSLKTTYYWHVRALNSGGTTYANGSPTAFWSFRTLDPPGAFGKTSPSNGSTGVSLSTTLSWNSSSFATSYQYCYDLINDNQCNRTWSSVPTASAGISDLGTNTTYYWQVRAVNAAGTTEADSSNWRSFTTTSTLPAGLTKIEALIGDIRQGAYTLAQGQSLRESYTGGNNGPVKLASTNAVPLIGAERVIYKVGGVNTSFTELMGLPDGQLDNVYWLPWYNNVGLDTQLRIANATNNLATVTVTIGGVEMPSFELAGGESTRVSYPVNDGPVQIVSDQKIVAAERMIYKVSNVETSFSELMALPSSQLDDTYWFPWYNNVNLDTQLRIGNVSGSTATVHVFIGGNEVTPIEGITLLEGASTRLSYAGVNDGPVQIVSDQNIVAAERVIYKVNNKQTSYSEIMGLPGSQLDTSYWLPWYNNVNLDTQLRIGNVSGSTATVHVFIGGEEVTPVEGITLLTGESTRVSYPGVNDGPVQIVSDQDIVAAERVIYKVNNIQTSFSEIMALPASQLDDTYWFPWYNNLGLDTQLRFGVP